MVLAEKFRAVNHAVINGKYIKFNYDEKEIIVPVFASISVPACDWIRSKQFPHITN